MTYPDALSYLGETRRFGMKLGLEPMRELARALGDPQERLRFIHLAGTNGKGSTAAFCESCLRPAGFRAGLYTSPHLVSVRERIQINRRLISEADFAEGMTVVRRAVEKAGNHEATFFELTTALALWYFAREKVDWVVWETGLGGRLDATNIVTPEVCIITNIGLDHQQYLGQSLREIAAEKAGIIKPGVPVVSAVEMGGAGDVIRDSARAGGCALTLVHRDMEVKDLGLRGNKQIVEVDGHEFTLGLIGPHQVQNAACAVAVMRRLGVSEAAIARGLAETNWPGRFEILSGKPLIVLDGAHNSAGTAMLVATWRAFLTARFGWDANRIDAGTHLVFASVADKDISSMAQLLRPLANKVSLVRLANERSAEPASLAEAFAGLPCACYDSVSAVWRDIENAPESIFLITGSLFLVGEMLARRRHNAEEYRLNERLEKVTVTR
ncbi:MAG TPA: folylpolyglutamate synthase/dihydrofolate synthase family protein [Candidatus Methylacidiphilales bacterium]|nr:folylpolyglutamate synthase/dihydrofolate synthase family protein [Candidatus Methylacidiphilales bacterium]